MVYRTIDDITNKYNLFIVNDGIKNVEAAMVEIFNGNVDKYKDKCYNSNGNNICYILGLYYQYELGKNKNNFINMKYYYDQIIINNNVNMLSNVYCDYGFYYDSLLIVNNINDIDINDTIDRVSKMKYYYKKAIKLNNSCAMYNLADYYQNKKYINYKKMKYYYKMAIKFNDTDSMYSLAYYYGNQDKNKNYKKMKYYYKMAIKFNDFDSMNNLGIYYGEIEINYNKMKYYFNKTIYNNYIYSNSHILYLKKFDQYKIINKMNKNNIVNTYISKQTIDLIKSYNYTNLLLNIKNKFYGNIFV